MKKILFAKMNGAGNDFVIFDKTKYKSISFNKQQISNICNRRKGIGGDGLIVISSAKNGDFSMEYFNSDGSTGSLCGNGARCAIQYASDTSKLKDGKVIFQANDESFSGEVLKHGLIKFEMKTPKKFKLNFRIKAASQLIKSHFAHTGSPHVVIEIEDVLAMPKDLNSKYRNIQNFPVQEIGKEIRYNKDFAPEGTNVNFVQVKNEEVLMRTYERGVENETLACGTGAVASALVISSLKNTSPPIKIKTWGGDELIIDFQRIGSRFEKISLTGPATTVYTGEVNLEQF